MNYNNNNHSLFLKNLLRLLGTLSLSVAHKLWCKIKSMIQ